MIHKYLRREIQSIGALGHYTFMKKHYIYYMFKGFDHASWDKQKNQGFAASTFHRQNSADYLLFMFLYLIALTPPYLSNVVLPHKI